MSPILIAFFGNLIDTVATLYLHANGFTEANPLMAQLLNYPTLFAFVKLTVMGIILIWLYRERDAKYAQIASTICAIVYGSIALYYVWFFTFLL